MERDASVPGAGFEFPQPLMDRDFPGARSVVGALRSNPGAVGTHLRHNLGLVPHSLDVLLLRPWHYAASWRWAWIGGLAALVAWIGLLQRRRWRRLVRRHRALLVALALAGLASLPTNLLIRPRANLSLAWVPFVAAVLALSVRAGCRGRAARWVEPALVLLPLGLLVAAPRPFAGDVGGQREVRLAARLLQRADFAPSDRLAALFGDRLRAFAPSSSLAAYDLFELRNVPPDPTALAAAFQAAAPTWLLTSPTTMLALGPLAPLLEAELGSDRWDLVDIALPVLLYRRAR